MRGNYCCNCVIDLKKDVALLKSGRNQRLALIALFCAQAIIISVIERQLPSPLMVAPGAKIGLANVITCVALVKLGARDTLKIILVRLVVTAFLTGGLSSLIYGISGAALSFSGMVLVQKLFNKHISLIGISVIGGFMHNVGQLLVAVSIARTWTIFLYLPVLAVIGIIAGVIVGWVANYLLIHIERLNPTFE